MGQFKILRPGMGPYNGALNTRSSLHQFLQARIWHANAFGTDPCSMFGGTDFRCSWTREPKRCPRHAGKLALILIFHTLCYRLLNSSKNPHKLAYIWLYSSVGQPATILLVETVCRVHQERSTNRLMSDHNRKRLINFLSLSALIFLTGLWAEGKKGDLICTSITDNTQSLQ
jgi:hypothetical protein